MLDFWICSNLEQSHADAPAGNVQPPPAYQKCDKDYTIANIFLCTHSSVENLVQAAEFHFRHCSKNLHQSETSMRGGVTVLKLKCQDGHIFSWTSSPYLPNGHFTVNTRFVHSYLSTGILQNQFERFSNCLGFSGFETVTKTIENDYRSAVDFECRLSCESAIMEEIVNLFDNEGSVDIMTDAKHGHRKNAKDTNVICLGQTTHISVVKKKTKALSSCAVTVQLICAFDFHICKIKFSHNVARIRHIPCNNIHSYIHLYFIYLLIYFYLFIYLFIHLFIHVSVFIYILFIYLFFFHVSVFIYLFLS